ncbi:hypothetical protein HTG_05680 [Natrinema mahii]|nr:hypothetical protein HTG_05680 [Natrinema mahii]
MTIGASSVLGISGCYEESREPAPEPEDHPTPPEQLTSDSVVDFVRKYETATFHNHILSNEQNPESIDASCNAVFDREIESAFYVLTRCGGSATLEDGIAEYPSSAYGITTYRVTENQVQRVTASPAERPDGYLVLLANFDDSERDVSVVMTSVTESDDETILEESLALDSEEGIEHRVESDEATEYELTVNRDDKTTATFADDLSRSAGVSIYLTANEVEIGALSSLP